MKKIDKSSIDNRLIPDAVMTQVIPLLNEVVDRIGALERQSGPVAEKTPLPSEMPYDDMLRDAGIAFLEDVPPNPAMVKGIGPKRGKEINEWREANE